MRQRSLATLAATAMIGGAALLHPAVAGAYTSDTHKPIIFVHGYVPFQSCPDNDTQATWGTMITQLQALGWDQAMVKEAYYACDTNFTDSLDSHGSHSTYFGTTGHVTAADGHTSHNTGADIRHLAYHLAWQIYDEYSSKGTTVQIVAHSMGSLITRWMLYRIQNADPNFPPYLYVQDVVTFGGPYGGSGLATFCSDTECTQMKANSSFLKELQTNAPNPQATGGTDWTIIGSNCDTVVSASSATTMGNVHTVIYSSPCYGHSDYMNDTSTASDASVSHADPPSGTFVSWTTALHAVSWANNALQSSSW